MRREMFAMLLVGLLIVTTFLGCIGEKEGLKPYQNPNPPVEKRVEDLLKRMTLEEKIEQLSGGPTGFSTRSNDRLGIPGLKFVDCPHGIRGEEYFAVGKEATCFPVSIAIGSSWDPELMEKIAAAIGKEARANGRNCGLAPCINVIRDPRGGRSQETYGEDPYLISKMGVAYVKGLQSQKVIATPKYIACHNHEDIGCREDAVYIDERTLREIYLPHFKACVKEGGTWAIMCTCNGINGEHCCYNKKLLRDILKDEWGFKGFVVSDWGACYDRMGGRVQKQMLYF
jgi:beta-glucosidase